MSVRGEVFSHFPVLIVSITAMEILNFPCDLLSRKYLPQEYRENKSLAKLNRFTVIKFYTLVCPLSQSNAYRTRKFCPLVLHFKMCRNLKNLHLKNQTGHLMRLWYSSHRRPAKAQASLCIHTVSPEPSLFAHIKNGRRSVRPKIRHLAPLDGCTCAFEGVYGGRKVP